MLLEELPAKLGKLPEELLDKPDKLPYMQEHIDLPGTFIFGFFTKSSSGRGVFQGFAMTWSKNRFIPINFYFLIPVGKKMTFLKCKIASLTHAGLFETRCGSETDCKSLTCCVK
jgi:hypothetical protein